ncbi:hypothetical protein Aab01nite_43510 [Paractinoplanes abujensis]|uniref:Uncharacterized protein n=1 Tax=Paractinoplanes abujensis TaxID=882441 RepID=A0A7W7CMW2_9ACTN|nr:hypothetical protein [Actinoplanes abujensis]MBB4689988.1 hypothetical protein [Actinoplanes abujensis]GID20761.1 hypothetical protein Aab01nite_43510 [Actinoplanes abujensis]
MAPCDRGTDPGETFHDQSAATFRVLAGRARPTADGELGGRFQAGAEGRNRDPSIAAVWSFPVTG